MRFNGWVRILVVLSLVWLTAIGVFAFMDYPTVSRFGGIPVGPFSFWSVIENIGNSSMQYHVEPKLRSFVDYGAFPIFVLWISYYTICWIVRGFRVSDD